MMVFYFLMLNLCHLKLRHELKFSDLSINNPHMFTMNYIILDCAPFQAPGGTVTGDRKNGSVITVQCDNNHYLVNGPTSKCVFGHWSKPLPYCQGLSILN